MPTAPKNVDGIDIGRVFFDLENPRHEPFKTEDQVIDYLCEREEVYPLARDIARHGLNPAGAIRRSSPSNLKVVASPATQWRRAIGGGARLSSLVIPRERQRTSARRLNRSSSTMSTTPITRVAGVVFDNKDDATIWLERIHGGTQGAELAV